MTATTTTSGLIQAGTTKLYHEVRGSGPALLIIGGTGDAGEWANLAPTLAQECTVVTYDRRGMSRSPRPDGWTATSMAEMADDAAALLGALDLAPAVVVGHSGGASMAWPGGAPSRRRAAGRALRAAAAGGGAPGPADGGRHAGRDRAGHGRGRAAPRYGGVYPG